ncbi:MAG: hypothetical protein ACXAC7_14010 [Candidatus Hodarchaeales archaeon]|jgi:FtsH-binding integral membrane protein
MFNVEFVDLLSSSTWLIFIIAGIISSLSFASRVAEVFENESLAEWLKFIAYSGFVIGVVILAVTAANFIGPHVTPRVTGKQTGWDVLVLGLVTGLALSLKPIKDMKWAALVTVGVGVGIMILIWMFVPSGPSYPLIAVVLIICFIVYIAFKFIEDFYLLISDILTLPPVAVGLGVLCIIEGILLLLDNSLLSVATGF